MYLYQRRLINTYILKMETTTQPPKAPIVLIIVQYTVSGYWIHSWKLIFSKNGHIGIMVVEGSQLLTIFKQLAKFDVPVMVRNCLTAISQKPRG